MATLQQLIPASFRGVPFLVPSGHMEGGRHAIKHEYPDSNHRYVEDNGMCVPDFELRIVVHGADAISRLRTLQNALDKPGPGTLIHPIYGRRFVQVVGPYKLSHKDQDVGVFELEVKFSVTGPPIFPGLTSGIAAAITNLSASAIGEMFASFSANVPIAQGVQTTELLIKSIGEVTSSLVSSFGAVADVRSNAIMLSQSIESIVNDPSVIAKQLQTMVRSPFDAVKAVRADELWRGFSEIGEIGKSFYDQSQTISPDTMDLAIRRQIMSNLGGLFAGVAFSAMAEAAAGKTYSVANAIELDMASLTDLHSTFIEMQQFDNGMRLSTAAILSEIIAVLEAELVTLPNVVSTKVNDIPASVLAYMLYDNDKDLGTIVSINSSQAPMLLNETANILHV